MPNNRMPPLINFATEGVRAQIFVLVEKHSELMIKFIAVDSLPVDYFLVSATGSQK